MGTASTDDDYYVNLQEGSVLRHYSTDIGTESLSSQGVSAPTESVEEGAYMDVNNGGQNVVTFIENVTVKAGQVVTGPNIPYGAYVVNDVTNKLNIELSQNIAAGGLTCPGLPMYPCKLEFGGTAANFRLRNDGTDMVVEDIWGMLAGAAATPPTVVAPVPLFKAPCGGTCGLNPPSDITGTIDDSATSPANTNAIGQNTITLTASPTGAAPGMLVTGTGIPAGTVILAVSGNDITLTSDGVNSANIAAYDATGAITINPWVAVPGSPCEGLYIVGSPASVNAVDFADGTNDKGKCYKTRCTVAPTAGEACTANKDIFNAAGEVYASMEDGVYVFDAQADAFVNTDAKMSMQCRHQVSSGGIGSPICPLDLPPMVHALTPPNSCTNALNSHSAYRPSPYARPAS